MEESREAHQSCFDLIAAYLIGGIMDDDDFEPNKYNRAIIIDEVLTVLDEHLDETGKEMLEEAFKKIQHEQEVEAKTQEIIQNLDWNKE